MKAKDFFIQHPDGSYEPTRSLTINGPSGRVTLGPGIRLKPGVRFMGIDITEILYMDIQIN